MPLHSAIDYPTIRHAHSAFAVMVAALFMVLPGPALAQLSDVKGSKDHPMVSRYGGSIIIGYDFRKFDEFIIPLGVLKRAGSASPPTLEPVSRQRVEGRVTRILYVGPRERSPLEVIRNYELELKKSGFETLYTCAATACGEKDGWFAHFYLYPQAKQLSQTPPRGAGAGQISENALSFAINQRYLAAKRSRPEGDVYVSVYVATNTWNYHKETHDHPMILLDVIDAAPIETGMVKVDASAMAKDISITGHVALYGIHFDTDKADPKPESQPTLQEIAKLLKQDASMKLYIVGHTDNVGAFDYNVGLSERRAAAVVKELTLKHGIAATRLKPAGVGMLSPVAPNDGEEGRAKNRRVELVKQ